MKLTLYRGKLCGKWYLLSGGAFLGLRSRPALRPPEPSARAGRRREFPARPAGCRRQTNRGMEYPDHQSGTAAGPHVALRCARAHGGGRSRTGCGQPHRRAHQLLEHGRRFSQKRRWKPSVDCWRAKKNAAKTGPRTKPEAQQELAATTAQAAALKASLQQLPALASSAKEFGIPGGDRSACWQRKREERETNGSAFDWRSARTFEGRPGPAVRN